MWRRAFFQLSFHFFPHQILVNTRLWGFNVVTVRCGAGEATSKPLRCL